MDQLDSAPEVCPTCSMTYSSNVSTQIVPRDTLKTTVLVFGLGTVKQSIKESMAYNSPNSSIQAVNTDVTKCSHCDASWVLGRNVTESTDNDGSFVFLYDSTFILSRYVRISKHKVLRSNLARLVYNMVVRGVCSFTKIADVLSATFAQSVVEQTNPESSVLYSAALQHPNLPKELQDVGNSGISASLLPEDVATAFFMYAAAIRALRVHAKTISFQSKTSFMSYQKLSTLFSNFIVESVQSVGMFATRDHACTDCTMQSPLDDNSFIQSVVLDGVTATCPVCAEPGCCGALTNTTRHRYCEDHFIGHFQCGIRRGPEKEGRCPNFVKGISRSVAEMYASKFELPTNFKLNLTCETHFEVEKNYRKEATPIGREMYLMRLRAAGVRGKASSKESKRRPSPSTSDHCRSAIPCKGAWDAMEKAMPSCDTVREYTVSFRRKFAYVFCVMMYPCGLSLTGKFFGDSESPREIASLVFDYYTSERAGPVPGLIFFDAACKVLRSILADGGVLEHLRPFFAKSAWLVPPIHMQSHKLTDTFCQYSCNPKLIAGLHSGEKGHRFNGTVVEQLFATLGGFDSSVRSMRKVSALALLYSFLDERNAHVDAQRKVSGIRFHDRTGRRTRSRTSLKPR